MIKGWAIALCAVVCFSTHAQALNYEQPVLCGKLFVGHFSRTPLMKATLKANWIVPQTAFYINLRASIEFILNPIPAEILISPITESELNEIEKAMNDAHAKYGVRAQTVNQSREIEKGTKVIDRNDLRNMYENWFQNLLIHYLPVLFILPNTPQMIRKPVSWILPSAIALRKFDEFFFSNLKEEQLAEIQRLAAIAKIILDGEEMRQIAMEHRLRVNRQNIEADERLELKDQLANEVIRLLETQFQKLEPGSGGIPRPIRNLINQMISRSTRA